MFCTCSLVHHLVRIFYGLCFFVSLKKYGSCIGLIYNSISLYKFSHYCWLFFPERSLVPLFHWNGLVTVFISFVVLVLLVLAFALEFCLQYFSVLEPVKYFVADCWFCFLCITTLSNGSQPPVGCSPRVDSSVFLRVTCLCPKECSGKFPVCIVCWTVMLSKTSTSCLQVYQRCSGFMAVGWRK